MADSNEEIVVAIPLFERFTALDVVGPYEVLHWVPNVVVKFVADEAGKDVNAEHGTLSMKSTASYDDLPNPHIVLVPGGPGITEALTDQRLLNWIKQAHTTSMFTTSVCIGGIILASLGLLKGLTATTHWNFYEQLASYGAIPIEQRVIRHGKIITSAGVSSGIDMALHLVAILKGDDMSKIMQLFVEYDPQPPFDSGSATKAKEDGTLERTLDMIPQLEARAELMYNQLVNNKD